MSLTNGSVGAQSLGEGKRKMLGGGGVRKKKGEKGDNQACRGGGKDLRYV